MPTYEYECQSCSHNFEIFQPMSDSPLKDCPKCGKEVRRLIFGGAGVIFKGSGFYVNDKKQGGEKSKSSPNKSETPAASNDGTKSEPASPAAVSPCSTCPKNNSEKATCSA